MKKIWNWLAKLMAAAAMLLVCGGAVRAQETACELVNTNLDVDFGSTTLSGAALDTVSSESVTLNCTGQAGRWEVRRGIFAYQDTIFRVCVGLGNGSGGSSGGQRQMNYGTNSIRYQLYSNPQRTIPIGSIGEAGGTLNTNYDQTATLSSNEPMDTYHNILITLPPFYGRIAAGQSTAPVGAYSSTFASAGDLQIRWGFSTGFRNVSAPPPCDQLTNTLSHPGFQAKVNVVPFCTLVSTPNLMDFGTHSTPGEVVDVSAGLSVRCTNGTNYTIGLDSGKNAIGTQRRMRRVGGSISQAVNYNLYRNAARSQLWRDSPTADVVTGTGSGLDQPYTIYARATIPNPVPGVGQFEDTVVIKVYY